MTVGRLVGEFNDVAYTTDGYAAYDESFRIGSLTPTRFGPHTVEGVYQITGGGLQSLTVAISPLSDRAGWVFTVDGEPFRLDDAARPTFENSRRSTGTTSTSRPTSGGRRATR